MHVYSYNMAIISRNKQLFDKMCFRDTCIAGVIILPMQVNRLPLFGNGW